MTVCTAAMFTWIYDVDKEDFGPAIVAASDRMMTDEGLGVEYSGGRWKVAHITKHHVVMVSGPFTVHSELVQRLFAAFKDASPTTAEIAEKYSALLIELKREQAAKLYLDPLPPELRERYLSGNHRELDPSVVAELTAQLLSHKLIGDPQAIIAGCDGHAAHLYHTTSEGLVTCHDDIGFVSIGSGGVHSSAHLMREEYQHATQYFEALFTIFSAKKRAEVAPGVDDTTDMFFITREGVTRILPALIGEMNRLYKTRETAMKKSVKTDAKKIAAFEAKLFKKSPALEDQQQVVTSASKTDPSSSAG